MFKRRLRACLRPYLAAGRTGRHGSTSAAVSSAGGDNSGDPQRALTHAMREIVQREWPAEPEKPGRSLREMLLRRYDEESASSEHARGERSDKLKEISALKELAENKWMKTFPPPPGLGAAPGAGPDARFRVLSTAAQLKVPGLKARHFFVYWGKRILGMKE